MALLEKDPKLTQRELAEKTKCSIATIKRVMQKLIEDECIRREGSKKQDSG